MILALQVVLSKLGTGDTVLDTGMIGLGLDSSEYVLSNMDYDGYDDTEPGIDLFSGSYPG